MGASAVLAQDAPEFKIGAVEVSRSMNIGGQVAESQNLKPTDLKALGTWTFADKEGQHGVIYVDDQKMTEWKDKNLVVSVGKKLLKVARVQRFDSGETALITDDLDEESLALLRQGNFGAPLGQQIKARWQRVGPTRARLLISKSGAGTPRLALDNAQVSMTLTRNGEEIAVAAPDAAGRPMNFEILGAGALWRRDFDLSRYADLSQRGHYQAAITYRFPAQSGAASEGLAPSTMNLSHFFEFDVPAK